MENSECIRGNACGSGGECQRISVNVANETRVRTGTGACARHRVQNESNDIEVMKTRAVDLEFDTLACVENGGSHCIGMVDALDALWSWDHNVSEMDIEPVVTNRQLQNEIMSLNENLKNI